LHSHLRFAQFHLFIVHALFSFKIAALVFFINPKAAITLCLQAVCISLSSLVFPSSLFYFAPSLILFLVLFSHTHFQSDFFIIFHNSSFFHNFAFVNLIKPKCFEVLKFIFETLNFVPLICQNPFKISITTLIKFSIEN
jgi:hypothetical protein